MSARATRSVASTAAARVHLVVGACAIVAVLTAAAGAAPRSPAPRAGRIAMPAAGGEVALAGIAARLSSDAAAGAPSDASDDAALEAEEGAAADDEVLAFAHDVHAAVPGIADARAASIASVAVAAARQRRLPLPLVFGVLLTESPSLESGARSPAGALGLMQVMPLWSRTLGRLHGHDLRNDTTNIATGTHILDELIAQERNDLRRGLMRYNGCTGGRLVCRLYVDRVVRIALTRAPALCPSRSFEECVAYGIRARTRPRPLVQLPGVAGD